MDLTSSSSHKYLSFSLGCEAATPLTTYSVTAHEFLSRFFPESCLENERFGGCPGVCLFDRGNTGLTIGLLLGGMNATEQVRFSYEILLSISHG
jgi:hypothetical protein